MFSVSHSPLAEPSNESMMLPVVGNVSTPKNVHLRPYTVFLDWHIVRVIICFINCQLHWHLAKRYNFGPTD